MPKRVLDGEAIWASGRLLKCPEWVRVEYAWIHPLADAKGVFEISDPYVVWRKCYAIRPSFVFEHFKKALYEFFRCNLMFVWNEKEKIFAYWTNSEKPGRLPSKSTGGRYEGCGVDVPKDKLREYLDLDKNRDDIMIESRLGFGFGISFGSGFGKEESTAQRKNGAAPLPSEQTEFGTEVQPENTPPEAHADPQCHKRATPQEVLKIWQDERGELPPVRSFTNQRLSKCRARLSEDSFSLEDFRESVRKASRTPFLRGDNDRRWRVGFDFMIANDTNYVAILEGKYDGGPNGAPISKQQQRAKNTLEAARRAMAHGGNSPVDSLCPVLPSRTG